MSWDSVSQLIDARSHQYHNWHPPAMAALWTLLELIAKGPAPMLVLQGTLFLVGTYRLLRRVLSETKAAIIAIAILLFPPVLSPMAVIWKDSLMAGCLVMAISLLLDEQRCNRWVALGLLTLAAAFRDNATSATLPLLLVLWRWPRCQRLWAQLLVALGIWALTVACALTTNKLLTKVEQHAWYVSLGPADIIGTLKQSRKYSDEELLHILDGTPLVVKERIQAHARKHYNLNSWWHYMNGDTRMFDWPVNVQQRDAVARAWRTIVLNNPSAYLLHRLRVFRRVLGAGRAEVFDPVWSAHVDLSKLDSANPFVEASGVQKRIADANKSLAKHTVLYRPYLYCLFAIVLLALGWRRRDALALLTSGLTYELPLFFFAPSPDYRYSHWLVVCTVISFGILLSVRIRAGWTSKTRASGPNQCP